MIIVSGILATLLVLALMIPLPSFRRKGDAAARIALMYSLDVAKQLAEKKTDKETLEYQLLSAGWNMDPRTFRLLQIGVGLATCAVVWLFIPGLAAIVAGAIGWYIPQTILDDRVKGRGREIDKHLPLAVVRISTGLLTGGSIKDVLTETADSLDSEGPNPLAPELRLTAVDTVAKSVDEALDGLAKRAPSTSLSNLAHLLKGYKTSGGSQYAEAMNTSARNTQLILAARNNAQASASNSFNTVKIIIAALIFVLFFLSLDPWIGESMRSPLIQILIGIVFGIMTLGYIVMRNTIREAV